jgi:hypothetical protein
MKVWKWSRKIGCALMAAALSWGCATPARVTVPATPEGNACVRECMVVYNTCRSGTGGGFYGGGYYGSGAYYGGGASQGYSGSGNCSFQHADCLKTCPGAEVGSSSSPEPVTNGGIRYSDTRLSLSYLATLPRTGDALRWDSSSHNLGIEISSGQAVRFHVAAYYGYLEGLSMLRLEPAALGFPIVLRKGGRFRLELEPVLSLIDAELLFAPRGGGGNMLALGSSARLQLNFLVDRLYFAIAPLGVQARYFAASSSGDSVTDLALDYRPQLFVGIRF